LNQEAINKEAMYDGFYGVTTNLDCDIAEIIAINKRRWQIEECFRIMKTDFEARPIYLQREDRIKAHFLICFLSLLIYRLLESKLENEYTVESTLTALRDMNVCSIDGYGYIPTYNRTDLTDDLHNLFDFHTDTQIIKKSKMRSIIRKTKER
ncbi:MAG: transposase, partial [Erysipelotrichaceae bacterium]